MGQTSALLNSRSTWRLWFETVVVVVDTVGHWLAVRGAPWKQRLVKGFDYYDMKHVILNRVNGLNGQGPD